MRCLCDECAVSLCTDEEAMWKCYVCDPKPMANLIQKCTDVLKTIEDNPIVIKDKETPKKTRPVSFCATLVTYIHVLKQILTWCVAKHSLHRYFGQVFHLRVVLSNIRFTVLVVRLRRLLRRSIRSPRKALQRHTSSALRRRLPL